WKIPQIQERAVEAYRKILHDYSRFSVSTIDAFSQQVIRGFSYELGLDGAFRVELNLEKVKKDLIQRLYLKMNEQQALLDWMLERILAKVEEDKSWNVNADLSQ